MIKSRLAHLGLAMAALGFTAATPVLGLSTAYAAETVRAEVGAPLQAAQNLMKSGKNKEALVELKKADNVSGKTPHETYLIERVRAAAASQAGDNEQAARSFEALIASGKLSASEKSQFTEGLVGIYMRAKDYNKANAAINHVLKEHDDPKLRAYLMQNYYAMGNYSAATKELQDQMRSDEKAGRASSKDNLEMLANLQSKSGDKGAYVATLEKLVASYPSERYWTDLLQRVTTKQGFSERLGVDIYRLKLANGLLKKPSEYLELAQLVLRDGAPGEAVKIIDKGYKAGILGTGADAPRHQRLKDLAEKTLADNNKNLAVTQAALNKARDNDGLVALGYALVQAGQADKGLPMMEAAIKSGDLKHPEDAKLHLGQAYAVAGKKSQAISTLKSVGGKDGTAEIARYWVMAINHPMA